MEPICVVPVGHRAQRVLSDIHTKLEESHEQGNIRAFQRSIRRTHAELGSLPIVQPFASWNFIEGTPLQEKIVKEKLSEREILDLADALYPDSTTEQIQETVLRISRREKALKDWRDIMQIESKPSKWSTFPTRVQDTIEKIEESPDLKWENRLLDLLIDPQDVDTGWSQIALEPDVQQAIVEIISQPSTTDSHAYGILKHARIGGALLYGPPGYRQNASCSRAGKGV